MSQTMTAHAISRMTWLVALVVLLFVYPLVPSLDQAIDHALGLPMQLERLLVSIFIFSLLSLSVHTQFGLGGLMQLGSAALFGVGAYVFGLCTVEKLPLQLSPLVAFGACAAVGAAVAAGLGALCARMRGDAVGMATLAFGEIWRAMALNAESITDGSRGLNPLPSPMLPAVVAHVLHVSDARSPFVALYWSALLLLVGVSVCLWRLAEGPMGRAFAAMRADPLAAQAMGIHTAQLRLRAMAYGGAIASVGGGMYASYLTTTAEPNTYDFNVSVMALCAVVLGGLGTVGGALVGAAFVVFFDTAVGPLVDALLQRMVGQKWLDMPWASFGHWRWLIFGVLLIGTMQWRPQGLLGRRS